LCNSLLHNCPGHNVRVQDRIKDRPTREWYLRAALEHGWSQNVLVHMISGQFHEREGKALTNFKRNLPPPDSDMAQQILRDPYNFDFLTLADPFAERELERGLLIHLRDLLLELGRGFAFVGSQVRLVVDDHSFHVDLLFYHIRLHCYFVIELKTGEFQPEYAGKLGFLSLSDQWNHADAYRRSDDRTPTLREPERPHCRVCSA
jgi:predicted nuclease of restriction endonuclease-like (RecB) superfamily